jgi:hypothetical protein
MDGAGTLAGFIKIGQGKGTAAPLQETLLAVHLMADGPLVQRVSIIRNSNLDSFGVGIVS